MERLVLDVNPDSTINRAPPRNLLGGLGWFGKFAEAQTTLPMATKANETELLESLAIKRQADGHRFPTRAYAWRDTETWSPLPSSEAVGKMIAGRLDSIGSLATWSGLQTDANTINYLADMPKSSFFGVTDIQNTPDTGESLRRERIVGTLRAFEASYVGKNGIPKTEDQWSEMYKNCTIL